MSDVHFDDGLDRELDDAPPTAPIENQTENPTQLRLRLHKAGFSPIPVSGKAPSLPGWQKMFDTNDATIELWAKVCHLDKNTGIITRNTPGLDIDFKDEEAAEALEELARERFGSR